jgi:hypothetical protein
LLDKLGMTDFDWRGVEFRGVREWFFAMRDKVTPLGRIA